MENIIKKMLIEEPFYGFLLTSIERRYVDKSVIPTLAVCFDKKMNAQLLVNKEFFNQFNDDQKLALLKHEMLHLAFKHIVLSDSFKDKKLFNIAADLEVNGYIKGLPPGGLVASDYGFHAQQGTLWYYRQLMQKVSFNNDNSPAAYDANHHDGECGINQSPTSKDGNTQNVPEEEKPHTADGNATKLPNDKQFLDDHSVWEQTTDSTERELASELINTRLLMAAEAVKSRGHIPGELSVLISELQKPLDRVFDWKKMLRRFIGNSYDEKKKTSRRKESKRFAGASGSKHMKRTRMLVGIDTSASVSNKELREFVSELTYMYKAGTDIYVLECDASIHKQYEFKPGCIEGVSGRGGTSFDPVVDYYKEHYKDFDSLVYFTDGEAPYDHLKIPQNNMLWVISSNGSKGTYPGKTLYIPKTNN
jgi:predicted metal-dependent peptidase